MSQESKELKPKIYEERIEEVVISPNDGKPTLRIARFLKPFAKNIDEVAGIPQTPLLSDIFTHKNQQKWPFKVHFTGWKKPQKDWKKWYDKLVINHGTEWIEAGIIDGIQASLLEIPCNKELVLGVTEFWCSKTNTFMFPWGEATITLEDVMILGGFPVIGDPVSQLVEGDSVKVVEGLTRARREVAGARERKKGERVATHSDWMKHFMVVEEELEEGEMIENEDQEGEFEHVAFLCLWLSRFVFPDVVNEGTISKNVIPIATHLSQGKPIALGPVVLANLYNDLTYLTQKAVDPNWNSSVYVSGLFQIVQLWVCERFPGFGANLAKPLEVGDLRVDRWDKVEFDDVTLSFVRSWLTEGDNFRWRPYACDLEKWDHHLPFYEETEQIISDCLALDDCLLSFGRFLHSSELVGIDCDEIYRPYRVAMQFGYDQEIPGQWIGSSSSWAEIGFYVPSRAFEPGVSRSYYDWWKDCMMYREEAIMDALGESRDKDVGKRSIAGQQSEGNRHHDKENKSASYDIPMLKHAPGELERSAQHRVNMEPSSLPLVMEKQEDDHTLTAPKRSKTVEKNSTATVKKTVPQKEGEKDDVSGNLDNIPLALRLCSNPITKNASRQKMIRRPALLLPNSPCSSDPNVVSMSLDSNDTDHVPLAVRLQSLAEHKETPCKPTESYASTGNGGFPRRVESYDKNEELVSPSSYAVSQITSKKSSKGKTILEADKESTESAGGRNRAAQGLEARVTQLERDVSSLRTARYGGK